MSNHGRNEPRFEANLLQPDDVFRREIVSGRIILDVSGNHVIGDIGVGEFDYLQDLRRHLIARLGRVGINFWPTEDQGWNRTGGGVSCESGNGEADCG